MIANLINKTIYVGQGNTGPGRIVDQYPVAVSGEPGQTIETVQHRMATFAAAGRSNHPGMAGRRQGRPELVAVRHNHDDTLNQRMLAERQHTVFQNGTVQQFEVLLGPVRAHAPANTPRRNDSPEIRLARHGAATGSSSGVPGVNSWFDWSGLSIIW